MENWQLKEANKKASIAAAIEMVPDYVLERLEEKLDSKIVQWGKHNHWAAIEVILDNGDIYDVKITKRLR